MKKEHSKTIAGDDIDVNGEGEAADVESEENEEESNKVETGHAGGSETAEPERSVENEEATPELTPCRPPLLKSLAQKILSATEDASLEQLLAMQHVLQGAIQAANHEYNRSVVAEVVKEELETYLRKLPPPSQEPTVSPPGVGANSAHNINVMHARQGQTVRRVSPKLAE